MDLDRLFDVPTTTAEPPSLRRLLMAVDLYPDGEVAWAQVDGRTLDGVCAFYRGYAPAPGVVGSAHPLTDLLRCAEDLTGLTRGTE